MSSAEKIKNKYGGKAVEKSAKRLFVLADKAEAGEIVRYLYQDLGARFSIASGVDTRQGVEILYHMAFDSEDLMVTVKVLVEKPELLFESFTGFMPAANWIEREIHEMFGVNFSGHPKMETLLLPDDWPEGNYPLRKQSFDSEIEDEKRET